MVESCLTPEQRVRRSEPCLSSLIALTRDWEYVASPPTLPLRVFIRRSSPFYGRFFVRGVAVSGGEGVQRKVVVEKAARFFSPPSQ